MAINTSKIQIIKSSLYWIQVSYTKFNSIYLIDHFVLVSSLGEFASTNIFTTCYQENYSLDTILNKQYRNTISYLKNVSDDDLLKNKSVASEINGKELNLDYIYPEISYLLNCAMNELDLEENVCKIHKILCVSIQLLTDLKENLLILKSKLRAEDIQQIDACYLKHDFVKSDTLNSDQ